MELGPASDAAAVVDEGAGRFNPGVVSDATSPQTTSQTQPEAASASDGRGRQRNSESRSAGAALPSPSPTPPLSGTRGDRTPSASDTSSHDRSTGDSAGESPPAEPAAAVSPVTEGRRPCRSNSSAKHTHADGVRRLSASKMQELTGSLPLAAIPDRSPRDQPLSAGATESGARTAVRPEASSRTLSTPPTSRRKSSSQPPARSPSARRNSFHPAQRPPPLHLESTSHARPSARPTPAARGSTKEPRPLSPIPPNIPLPPMSVPTLLQLELAGHRPSPLYIYPSATADVPYESNAVKFERLSNFLNVPLSLEMAMLFGALACMDAWLWTFTILPIRFCSAFGILLRWWAYVLGKEVGWLTAFVWEGLGRVWRRTTKRPRASSRGTQRQHAVAERRDTQLRREPANGSAVDVHHGSADAQPRRAEVRPNTQARPASSKVHMATHTAAPARHRRTKSMPSHLASFHKADLLQGAVILFTSMALMHLDASRMYHFIRAQSAVKLYVIYNLVEVGDRLLSALGQDIFECLFSAETLSRDASGRSRLLLPFGMFLLALVYNVAHSMVLFYQVIALNVAVNSYSNALLSLLMSNQFVEVKSSVFKRSEKENTFQLTLADIVERFQLWIVLLIIAMRNIVEVGGLSVPGAGGDVGVDAPAARIPLHNASILPASFTLLPSWLASGEVLSPFLIVIGSEMVVDWIKHAYINKFNNIKPDFYGRILDILCKDYYTNAFVTPSLTRRLGLPLLPLCCLFIRASVQTYHMFLATHLPMPLPPSTHTSLSVESAAAPSPAMAAALDRLDAVIRNALGRTVHGRPYPATAGDSVVRFGPWSSDDLIAALTMVVVFFLAFLVLLVVKLLLGMALLRYARNRYAKMKAKEHEVASGRADPDVFEAKGKRVGAHAEVEVGDDRRRWIFADDPEGLRKLREREQREGGRKGKKEIELHTINRYDMVAKRIW